MPTGKDENFFLPAKGKPFHGKNKPARNRIRQVSKKKREQDKIYSKLRKEFLAKHDLCEVWLARFYPNTAIGDIEYPIILIPRSEEVHHSRGRGKFYLDVSTWAAVSAEGHRWIHANPLQAEALGLLDPARNKR